MNKIEYYAVYREANLGYLFIDSNGSLRFGFLHASILMGSTYNPLSDPLFIHDWDMKDVRRATITDFDSYRVSIPPDFN